MKLKLDFVTNSSSTTFTFCFKGDHLSLYKALMKRPEVFDLCGEYGWGPNSDFRTCNVDDVIRSIDDNINDSLNWNKQKTNNIDEKIEELQVVINDSERMNRSLDSWEKNYIESQNKKLKILKKAKRKGLTGVLKLGFGDNHGEICGGSVGTVMDYEGRNISIDDDDLIIFTEQNR